MRCAVAAGRRGALVGVPDRRRAPRARVLLPGVRGTGVRRRVAAVGDAQTPRHGGERTVGRRGCDPPHEPCRTRARIRSCCPHQGRRQPRAPSRRSGSRRALGGHAAGEPPAGWSMLGGNAASFLRVRDRFARYLRAFGPAFAATDLTCVCRHENIPLTAAKSKGLPLRPRGGRTCRVLTPAVRACVRRRSPTPRVDAGRGRARASSLPTDHQREEAMPRGSL